MALSYKPLWHLLVEKNMNKEDLKRAAHITSNIVSRMSINKIEIGKTTPTLKAANDIANTLGVCIYKIFDLDDTGRYRCLDCNCLNNQ